MLASSKWFGPAVSSALICAFCAGIWLTNQCSCEKVVCLIPTLQAGLFILFFFFFFFNFHWFSCEHKERKTPRFKLRLLQPAYIEHMPLVSVAPEFHLVFIWSVCDPPPCSRSNSFFLKTHWDAFCMYLQLEKSLSWSKLDFSVD